MNYKTKSNRYLSYGARAGSFYEIERLKQKPTAKQKKFHAFLCGECQRHELEPVNPCDGTRIEYAQAIDEMKDLLKKAGVDMTDGGKEFEACYYVGDGYSDEVFVRQRLYHKTEAEG